VRCTRDGTARQRRIHGHSIPQPTKNFFINGKKYGYMISGQTGKDLAFKVLLAIRKLIYDPALDTTP
jgi:hypothetical protein